MNMVMNHGPDCTTKASNDDNMMNTHFPKLAEISASKSEVHLSDGHLVRMDKYR